MDILGIDIGTSEIKGAIIDTKKGVFLTKVKTVGPLQETSPHKLASSLHRLVSKEFKWKGPIGCAIPESVRKGVVLTARRFDPSWEATDAEHLFSEITGTSVTIINDADASGIAEYRLGAAKKQKGVVILLTVGTGIGSALFVDGRLVPNSQLGLLEFRGVTVEERASNKSRKEEGLDRKGWAKRLEFVLEGMEQIFHPDLFVIGGQMSRKSDKILPYVKIKTPLIGAAFEGEASLVGAAILAADRKNGEKVFYI